MLPLVLSSRLSAAPRGEATGALTNFTDVGAIAGAASLLQVEAKRPLLWHVRRKRRLQARRLQLERVDKTFTSVMQDGGPKHTLTMGAQLGSGAQGEVFKATMEGKDVAVKVAKATKGKAYSGCDNPEFRKSGPEFEALLMGKVTHANVVKLLDHGRVDGSDEYVIVMDLHDGGTLTKLEAGPRHWLLRDWREDSRHGRSAMRDLVGAVGACHTAKVLHGDIKPNNILLGKDNAVVLMDFGFGCDLSKGDGKAKCPPGGTASYLPPEFFTKPDSQKTVLPWLSPYDPLEFGVKVDLWALGLTLFHVLAGFNPFVVPRKRGGGRPNDPTAERVLGLKKGLEGACARIPQDEENRAMEFLNEPLVTAMTGTTICDAKVTALLTAQGFETAVLSELCTKEKMLMGLVALMLNVKKEKRVLPTAEELAELDKQPTGEVRTWQQLIDLANAKSSALFQDEPARELFIPFVEQEGTMC